MKPDRTIQLNDGVAMPRLGFGVYKIVGPEAAALVGQAIAAGYRSIDTAAFYGNEADVGRAVASAPVERAALFVTTKIWNDDHGFGEATLAFERSRTRLGLGAVDLLLIHWPQPRLNRFVETLRALIALRERGLVRAIGVSNFGECHLERLIGETGVVPSVNQVELHPRFQQRALCAFHARHGIATECWGPLGRARFLDDPTLVGLARKHGRSPAQVVLRWHIESGRIVFGFSLDEADHRAIEAMDDPAGRLGMDPDAFG